MKLKNNAKFFAYIGIFAVILIWGLIPSMKKVLIGDSFSASVYTFITTFSSAVMLLLISIKSLKQLNRDYFKVAVPTGLCVGIAALAQALAYNFNASPVNQAFLENLSCIVVPIILFFMIKKRPDAFTVVACILCMLSSAVLAGLFKNGASFHTADILNALAGVFYGINIAFTGIYAKKFITSLYVMIQLFIQSFFALGMAVAFNFIKVGGSPIDAFMLPKNLLLILLVVGIGIVTNSVCWTIRTKSMKHISPTVVAIFMPFSAVVTGLFAVILKQDTLSTSLVIGAVLGIAAGIISGLGDMDKKKETEDQ